MTDALTATDPAAGAPHSAPAFSPVPGPTPPPRRRRPFATLLGALAVGLLGFAGGVGGYVVADQANGGAGAGARTVTVERDTGAGSSSSSDADSSRVAVANPGSGEKTPAQIYKAASPAVVHINAKIKVTDTSFFGIPQEREGLGTGSGFVIDEEGHIVTNAHVVENASEITVAFGDDVEVTAEVVGQDISSDLAVLKVDAKTEELKGGGLVPVKLGDSTKVEVGDPVVAIGNPFNLDRTLTTGVISALQREIPALNNFSIKDVIQTDAAVNPGNSGGPLLNMQGEVIGVNSQIQSRGGGFDGIAFAVPSSTVKRVSKQLIDSGSVKHAWLGVAGVEVTPEIADVLNLGVDYGVLVGEITDGSPADKAGIKGGKTDMVIEGTSIHPGGDVIQTFDGTKVETMRELMALVDGRQPGDKVKLTWRRDGKKMSATVKLGDRPDSFDDAAIESNQ